MASMTAADVLPGRAVSRRPMFEMVLANGIIKFRSIFQHWQYSYGEMILTLSFSDESLKLMPKSRWKGFKFGCSKAGADPFLLYTFVPTSEEGS